MADRASPARASACEWSITWCAPSSRHQAVRLGPRSGRDHGEPGQGAGELDRDRADAARAADDQQRFPRRPGRPWRAMPKRSNSTSQAVIEVSGSAAARREVEPPGLAPDDRLRRPGGTRCWCRAARFEPAYQTASPALNKVASRPDHHHHAGRVIAEHLGRAALRVGALAHLGVDRVDRNRLPPRPGGRGGAAPGLSDSMSISASSRSIGRDA